MTQTTSVSTARLAAAIRVLTMDAVEKAKSGHPGMPMGMADVATILYAEFLKFDAADSTWPDRDRFVLSAGHGSMLTYALLYLTGVKGVDMDQLRSFRQMGAMTAGHPEYGHCPGIETTTGPLGQGIATAVGMAIAERMLSAKYGNDLVDHRTFVMAGDGCLMEGISHEAIDLAGHLKLSRLVVLFDDNSISIDGATSLSTSMDQLQRFAAAGWNVQAIDGHNADQIRAALARACVSDKPSFIACKTLIGWGAPTKAGTKEMHGSPLGVSEIAAARQKLGWTAAPFEMPDDVLSVWRSIGSRGAVTHHKWRERLAAKPKATRVEFTGEVSGRAAVDICNHIEDIKKVLTSKAPTIATRVASQQVLEQLTKFQNNLVGGSADLTGSVGTKASTQRPITAGDFSGSYIHYGVREHAMAAAMNGIALHGGFVPYGGTFLVFSDYCRPAIRLSALMRTRVIYVMTHDSIGLGEDGPTHQPVEHIASLRAIPNTFVFRPADAVETAEAWAVAIRQTRSPSVLCLSRQNLPTLRTDHTDNNLVSFGAYVLHEPQSGRDVTLLATGSEVSLAMAATSALAILGVRAAVVSMPCWELFAIQPREFQDEVLGNVPCIGIEAGIRMGWDQWLGRDGVFIGMDGFGASAPADQLYKYFGITTDAIVEAAKGIAR